MLLAEHDYRRLVESGAIQISGAQAEGESGWLGVPLRAEGRTLGIVVVQDYERRLSEDDKDLLIFVGQHIATALTRARAIEETRERNAELAVINEIGDALARQLDFQAVIDLVGNKVREIFAVDSMAVVLYDEATRQISFPYSLDEGVRFSITADQPGRRADVAGHPVEEAARLRHRSGGGLGGCHLLGHAYRVVARRADPRRREGHRDDQPRVGQDQRFQ